MTLICWRPFAIRLLTLAYLFTLSDGLHQLVLCYETTGAVALEWTMSSVTCDPCNAMPEHAALVLPRTTTLHCGACVDLLIRDSLSAYRPASTVDADIPPPALPFSLSASLAVPTPTCSRSTYDALHQSLSVLTPARPVVLRI